MDGDASPRTRARWSRSAAHTLDSPRARHKFRQFLCTEFPRQPDSVQLDTLDFYEQCTALLCSSTLSGADKRVAARKLAEKVDSQELLVNLDEGLLGRLYNSNSTSMLKAALKDAIKEVAQNDPDLQDAYRQFINTL